MKIKLHHNNLLLLFVSKLNLCVSTTKFIVPLISDSLPSFFNEDISFICPGGGLGKLLYRLRRNASLTKISLNLDAWKVMTVFGLMFRVMIFSQLGKFSV